MRLEPTPRTEQVLRVSAKLITSSTILQLSADELERTVTQEQIENPALAVREQRICLLCGSPIYGSRCTVCGHFAQHLLQLPHDAPPPEPQTEPLWLSQQAEQQQSDVQPEASWAYQRQSTSDVDSYSSVEPDSEDELDLLAALPTNITLQETLLHHLEALVTPADAPIAEQLVGSLSPHGYLESSVEEIAAQLRVPLERVSYVLSQLQTLEPGLGARTPRESLLLQLEALSEQEAPHPLAFPLIDRYLNLLGQNRFAEIARSLGVSEEAVREAYQYIRNTLQPFPAYIYHDEAQYLRSDPGVSYIRPDVIIRKGEAGLEVELIEEKRYSFDITTHYSEQTKHKGPGQDYQAARHYFQHQNERARFFVDCVQRRWLTLRRVAELVVSYQREFFVKGVRAQRPLTRAEIASHLGLDEGTVSRAIANKYALLPNGRLIPFSDFFDGSLAIKDILRELIQTENPRHRLSDEELARLLTHYNILLARRTVTKYREEMRIGSSRERSQQR